MDKNIKFMTTLSAVLLFIFIILCVIAGAEETGDVEMVDMSEILINIACGVVPSIAVTIAMYFAFLRKIPQTTKDLIDKLLNDRLNHETANHNAIMGALNPDNKGLSREHNRLSNEHNKLSSEHKELRQSADRTYQFLREEKLSAENRQQLLTVEQRNIRNCVEGLSGFEKAMEVLQDQNVKLKEEHIQFEKTNRELRDKLAVNQEKIIRLQRENDSLKLKDQTHSREDIAREEEFERY